MKTSRMFLTFCAALIVLFSLPCEAFAAAVTLPADLETIEAQAFYRDTSITEVIVPSGVTSIGELAFAYSGLKKITIPPGTYIADNAFEGVADLTIVEGNRDWSACMQLPSAEEISNCNLSSTQRSPYLVGWFHTRETGRFSEICVDFKADYLPGGTYCSIANFDLDYSALESRYERIEYNHIAGYAGFQRNASPDRYRSILSFWDVFCYDSNGNMTKLQAKQIVPADQPPSQFDWEGSGVFSLRDYPWEAGKWYRALLQCGVSSETGNTTIEYWVMDLEAETWTQLYVFDLGVPDVLFKGDVAVFLENYQTATAGEIRSMEVRNFRVNSVDAGEWKSIETASFYRNHDYPGSYQYGSDGHTFWMITTGVPGLGSEEQGEVLTVKNLEEGIPYSN